MVNIQGVSGDFPASSPGTAKVTLLGSKLKCISLALIQKKHKLDNSVNGGMDKPFGK